MSHSFNINEAFQVFIELMCAKGSVWAVQCSACNVIIKATLGLHENAQRYLYINILSVFYKLLSFPAAR